MRIETGRVRLIAFVVALASAPHAFAQGGLPPNAGQIVREGMSRPRLSGLEAAKGGEPGPGGCFFRDQAITLVGIDFGPSAGSRHVMAFHGSAPVGVQEILSWSNARVGVKLAFGVDLEGETVTLDVVDEGGASATIGGGRAFPVCFRDQTDLAGTLRPPACSIARRTFRVVATGPARLEKSLTREPRTTAVPWRMASVALGSWTVTVEETTPPPARPFPTLPPSTALAGCDAPSLGFEPTRRTAVVAKGALRATGLDFVEILLPHPPPPNLGGLAPTTPTPGGPFTLPPPELNPVLPAPTRTPAR